MRGNDSADKTATQGTQFDHITGIKIPRGDLSSKLREIKDSIVPFSNSFNRNIDWERKLTTLRISHSNLTQLPPNMWQSTTM